MRSILLRQSALLLSFCIACSSQGPASLRTDEVVIGMSQEPDSLWPALASMMAGSEIKTHLGVNPTTGLTVIDETWRLMPNLGGYRVKPGAELQVPSLENGGLEDLCAKHPPQQEGERCGLEVFDRNGLPVKAQMVSHWELRSDARWSDGRPVTIDDVMFGLEFMMSKDLPVIDRSMEERIASIKPAKNPDGSDSKHRFDVYWKEVYAYVAAGGFVILPKHILEEPFIYNPGRLKDHWFGRKPIGWGPWMIQEYRRRSHIILVPNPHYWDRDKVRLKKITYRFIRSTNSLKAALEAGNIDATSETGLGSDEVAKLEKLYPERWNYHYRSGLVWEHIDLRSDYDEKVHKGIDNPLEDVRVRQALAYSANRPLLADAIFDGKVRVAHSYLPDVHYAYHKSLKTYEYSPEKAAKLLDAAGWKVSKSGIREKKGQPLKLRFGTTAENKIRELVQQVLQQDWKRVGIEIEVNNQPPSAFFGQTTHKRKFPHLAMYAWLLSPLGAGDTLYRADKIPSQSNNWQGQNYAGLRSDELTRLAIEGEKTLDLKKRISILHRVQEIFAEQLPAIPLYFRVNSSVTDKRLRNWKPTGTSYPTSWNSYDWYLEKGQ